MIRSLAGGTAALALLLAPTCATARTADPADTALTILTRSIGFRTVEGAGQVPAYAAWLKGLLVDGGYADADVQIQPIGDTAALVARWPGTTMAQIETTLTGIMADPGVTVTYQDSGTVDAPSSPLRPDLMAALTTAVHARAPGLLLIPTMEAGATDSMFFRALGVPAYGVSSVFMKPSDEFAHGLNERLPVDTLAPGVRQWDALLRDLAQ